MLPNPYLILGAVLAILGAFIAGDVHRGQADKMEYIAKIEAQNAAAEATKKDRVCGPTLSP